MAAPDRQAVESLKCMVLPGRVGARVPFSLFARPPQNLFFFDVPWPDLGDVSFP